MQPPMRWQSLKKCEKKAKITHMVTVRLARHGKTNDPFYRIVAVESSRKRGGKPLEILGYWHPKKDVKKVDKKKIEEWVAKGATVSMAVTKLMK